MMVHACPVSSMTVVVAIDVGKNEFAVSVTDAARKWLLAPVTGCPMTASSLREVIARIDGVLPAGAQVRVGVEAAGHYHLPLLAPSAWPPCWEVLELNPGHVTEQRKVMGRRTIKTDAVDLEAMTELLLAGRGLPVSHREAVLVEIAAWAGHGP
jgi:transposase